MAGMNLRGCLLHPLVTDFSNTESAQREVSAGNGLPTQTALMQRGWEHQETCTLYHTRYGKENFRGAMELILDAMEIWGKKIILY